ncbi:hypothetical protein [Nocardioides sp. Iso805N]|uniref:hypothetical protein n=1 Tax=Nocardioides sp. Iso805N TaxID=1283287 RepID=UPI00037B85FB|nr:hypothetical protein [Nocardioides sp. Iso805N]
MVGRRSRRAIDAIAPAFPPPDVAGLYDWASALILTNSESPVFGEGLNPLADDRELASTLTHELTHLAQTVMSAQLLEWQSAIFRTLLKRLAAEASGPVDETFTFQLHDVLRTFRPDPGENAQDAKVVELLSWIHRRGRTGLAPMELVEAHATWIEFTTHWSYTDPGPHFSRWLHEHEIGWSHRAAFDYCRFVLGDTQAEAHFARLVGIGLSHDDPSSTLEVSLTCLARSGPNLSTSEVCAALADAGIGIRDPHTSAAELGDQVHPALRERLRSLGPGSVEHWLASPDDFLVTNLRQLDPVIVLLPEEQGRIPVLRPARPHGWNTQSDDDLSGSLVESQMVVAAALQQYARHVDVSPPPAELQWLSEVSGAPAVLSISEAMAPAEFIDPMHSIHEDPHSARYYGRVIVRFEAADDPRPDAQIPWVRDRAALLLEHCPWLPIYLDFTPSVPQLLVWLGLLSDPDEVFEGGQVDLGSPRTSGAVVWLARQAIETGRERGQDTSVFVRTLLNALPAEFEPYFWERMSPL